MAAAACSVAFAAAAAGGAAAAASAAPPQRAVAAVSTSDPEVFWYLPQHLSAGQKAALAQLRAALTARALLIPTLDDDLTLLRFLKARAWDAPKAAEMYANMADWRAANGVDALVGSFKFPERAAVRLLYPMFFHKTDRHGRPVRYERVGAIDVGRLLAVTTRQRFLQNHIVVVRARRLVAWGPARGFAPDFLLRPTYVGAVAPRSR